MQRRVVLLMFWLSVPALACSVSSEVAGYSKAELIVKTATIVLAENTASAAEGQVMKFSFRTIEVLKGKDPGGFFLTLAPAPGNYVETDFSGHADPEFWQGTYGRLPWRPGACEPSYAFERGGRYLLFLESLGNGAAAERVRESNDRWYTHVRRALAGS